MIIEFNYNPLIEDFNADGTLKLESVLKILENSGNQHSDKAGDKILTGVSNGKTWVLTDWYVDVKRFPKYGEKLCAKTWCQPLTSMFGTTRDFELFSDGELCVSGTTRWVLFDFETNRLAKIEKELLDKYGPEENKTAFAESKLPKISIPESFTNEVIIKPRRNDVDFNNHVHNLVYVDYAMEVIPLEIYNKHQLSKIRITYKSAVKYGEELKVKYAADGDKHVICIYASDDSIKTLISLE